VRYNLNFKQTLLIFPESSAYKMVHLGNKIFRGKREQEIYDKSFAGKYQKLLRKNHFIYFGLPFLLSIFAGSLFLQKFTTIKWERYDEKYRQLNEEEMLSLIENKRPIDKKNDYYRLQGLLDDHLNKEVSSNDDYEMVRVARKKEDEPVW
jgi:cytochrome c oxidase assembly protein subunit 16